MSSRKRGLPAHPPATPYEQIDQPVFIDNGNKRIKILMGSMVLTFPHAFRRLTESEFDEELGRNKSASSLDFVRVNGTPYIVGDAAERGVFTPTIGRARYTRDYYGVTFAAALARIAMHYPDAPRRFSIPVFASHATDDHKFRENLRMSILGQWDIEVATRRIEVEIPKVTTYDEPHGTYIYSTITEDMKMVKAFQNKAVLVIDIGGGTVNMYLVEDGRPNYERSQTITMGVEDVLAVYSNELQFTYKAHFEATRFIAANRLRASFERGYYGELEDGINTSKIAEDASVNLIQQITNVMSTRVGGAGNVDHVIMTGGGSALFGERVKPHLKVLERKISYADDFDEIHFTNVRGAYRYWRARQLTQG